MTLHHRIMGEGGTPLLILHGLFGSSDNWQTLGRLFAEDRQVILVDQRNHGRSFHRPEMDYSIMAEDLRLLLNELGIKRAHILGHSMGGKTVMRFAMKHPSYCESILIADIGPGENESHHDAILRGLQAPNLEKLSSRKEVESALSESVKDKGVLMFLMKNLYWIEKGKLAWRMNLPVIVEHFQEILASIGSDTVMVPGLFIRGTASDYVRDEDWQYIERQFPMCDLASIEGAGHWLHAEQPEQFYDIVQDFLGV